MFLPSMSTVKSNGTTSDDRLSVQNNQKHLLKPTQRDEEELEVLENGVPATPSLRSSVCSEIVRIEQMAEEDKKNVGRFVRRLQVVKQWASGKRQLKQPDRPDSFLEKFAMGQMTIGQEEENSTFWCR
ncbi:uncharacterized protein LOC111083355, partial [Limulus polyphemus]|uniref:Uncharacterized protein LOC111083355 n=1 Tax=Limulus polyphemus TaxID=6850 RepID=A0ABM1RVZ6_LIMPO